jgi:hypothetical protein
MLQGMTVLAQDLDSRFTLSTGVDYTSGSYGGDVDIEDVYVPLTATLDTGKISYRLTVPYISVRAPAGTIFDTGGSPLPGSGDMTTESGLGDVIGSATLYDVFKSDRLGLAIDLTGKIKFGTADEDKGLGTGENDYTVQADVFKFVDEFTWIGSLGYTLRGEPDDLDLDDVLSASVGGTYKFNPDVRGGLFFDFRESAVSGDDDIRELSGFVSRRISDDWRIQVYALAGLSDSSPDLGGGIRIKRTLAP